MSDRPAPDLPPDNGKRPRVDRSGAVHGSGIGTGGSQPGEDFDDDPASGDGNPQAGGDGGPER